ncbi:MAG TPA: redoxin family protein [Pirellulales bacterium]|nr:redoxin family protein [Pirellulales bacterium]
MSLQGLLGIGCGHLRSIAMLAVALAALPSLSFGDEANDGLLARFRFDGNANDDQGGPPFELRNTEFIDNALYLTGIYEGNSSDGYHAVGQTPGLDYSRFSVVVRFRPDSAGSGKTNILTGGTATRWFGMQRSAAGRLTITLNNQAFRHEVAKVVIAEGKWTGIACAVDLQQGNVLVYADGQQADEFTLPPDFKLAIIGNKRFEERDKVWTFSNYSNGNVFFGLVDELLVYGKPLSDDQLAAMSKLPADLAGAVSKPIAAEALLRRMGARFLTKGAAASWSPDAKQVVFSALPVGSGIDRLDIASGKVTRLVAPGKDASLSPTGKIVAYVRGDGAGEEIWLADADGMNTRKLADGGFPRWAADGKTLYFHGHKEETVKAVDVTLAEPVLRDVAPLRDSLYPVVSPDGKSLAYVSGGKLAVVNLQTKNQVTRPLAGAGAGLVGWSPDSKQVAYGGFGGGDQVGLFVLDLAEGQVKQIATGQYTLPVFSPDGNWLAFDLRGESGDWQLWAIETDQLDTLKPYEPPVDRYVLPEGDVTKLLAFIKQLREFRPTNSNDFMAHREKGPKAIAAAAQKIMALDADKTSAAHTTARLAVLEPRVARLTTLSAADRKAFAEELLAALSAKSSHGLEPADVNLVLNAARMLEYGDDLEWAAQAVERLAKALGPDDGPFAEQARSLLGSARRLGLVGHELTLKGTTAAGQEFDWASYRGKVVLIDFWATWCGPCVAELPNVRELYDKYHERGFDVVGISLDHDRAALDKFLSEKGIPWTTLHQAGGQHPVATYYGVSAIPTMLLVGRDGKVTSIRTRGQELKRLLGELMQQDR